MTDAAALPNSPRRRRRLRFTGMIDHGPNRRFRRWTGTSYRGWTFHIRRVSVQYRTGATPEMKGLHQIFFTWGEAR